MQKNITGAYEFLHKYPNEQAARHYIEQRRWQGKPTCPRCNCCEQIQIKKSEGYFRCSSCKSNFTVRTGTIFEHSHISLDKWLYAIYLIVTAHKAISSLQLSKDIGVTQKTAWFLLKRLRKAYSQTGSNNRFFFGITKTDKLYISSKKTNKHESKKCHADHNIVGNIAMLGIQSMLPFEDSG